MNEREREQDAVAAPVDEPSLERRTGRASERKRPGADAGRAERAGHLLDVEQDREAADADREPSDDGCGDHRGYARDSQDARVDAHRLSMPNTRQLP